MKTEIRTQRKKKMNVAGGNTHVAEENAYITEKTMEGLEKTDSKIENPPMISDPQGSDPYVTTDPLESDPLATTDPLKTTTDPQEYDPPATGTTDPHDSDPPATTDPLKTTTDPQDSDPPATTDPNLTDPLKTTTDPQDSDPPATTDPNLTDPLNTTTDPQDSDSPATTDPNLTDPLKTTTDPQDSDPPATTDPNLTDLLMTTTNPQDSDPPATTDPNTTDPLETTTGPPAIAKRPRPIINLRTSDSLDLSGATWELDPEVDVNWSEGKSSGEEFSPLKGVRRGARVRRKRGSSPRCGDKKLEHSTEGDGPSEKRRRGRSRGCKGDSSGGGRGSRGHGRGRSRGAKSQEVEHIEVSCDVGLIPEEEIKQEPETCCADRLDDSLYYRLSRAGQSSQGQVFIRAKDMRNDSAQQTTVTAVNADQVTSQTQTTLRYFMNSHVQTDLVMSHMTGVEQACGQLITENIKLKAKVKKLGFDAEGFVDNNDKVKFFTAIDTSASMLAVYKLVKDYIQPSKDIDPFSKFLVTLMKLRFSLPDQFFAYMFQCSPDSISRIIRDVLTILDARIVPALIVWPGRVQLQNSTPLINWQLSPYCVYLMEILEVPLERPGTALNRILTHSAAKNQHTMKYLIAVTPSGAVTFVSKAWVGCSQDVHMVENSGFLDLIYPGDIILATRHFNVGNNEDLIDKTIKAPAFTKTQTNRLCGLEPEASTILGSIRIRLDQAVGGYTQRYGILRDLVPSQYLVPDKEDKTTDLDKLLRVCCALANTSTYYSPFKVLQPWRRKDRVTEEQGETTNMELDDYE